MLQSILLASDFQPASEAAAQASVLLASAFGSRVTVFHVLEPNFPQTSQELQDRLRQKLIEQHVHVTDVAVGIGSPAHAIVHKADELDSDLIIIGAGERTRFERFSVGPIATSIIEHAVQPVLAVRPGEPAARFKKVLCPVDQSDVSGRGLHNAIRLARAMGGEVIVLTVVPEVNWLTAAVEAGHLAGARAEYEKKWREEFAEFVAGSAVQDVKMTSEVRHGQPHEQIVAAAREHEADVIVIGATGRTGLVRVLLGSTTRRLLERLPCSILTVKHEDAVQELFEGEVRLIQQLLAEARTLAAAGDDKGALLKFRRVLAHNPYHIDALEELAATHERLGSTDMARRYRRRVEQLLEKA